jgi:hypothetical protein
MFRSCQLYQFIEPAEVVAAKVRVQRLTADEVEVIVGEY